MGIVEPPKKLITADELLGMGDIGRCELIYGELVMMSPSGLLASVVARRIGGVLGSFVDAHDLGIVAGADGGFLVETDPDLLRAPDVSFIAKANYRTPRPEGYYPGVPDLAVEVISPGDTRREVAEKVNMWLAHGTKTVWEVRPMDQTLTIHRIGQPAATLHAPADVSDEPLLPGFTLPLAQVFKMP